MKFRVLAIGKPKLRHAADGIADYQRRLTRSAEVDVEFLKEKDETKQLLEKSAGTYRIALDERGERLTTAQFVERIDALELRGDIKTVSFLIGGSDGHPAKLRKESDMILSLSSLTLQHELALVILLEQLYRAYTIKRGEPYHR